MAVQSAQKFPQWEYEIHSLTGRWGLTLRPTIEARLNELGAAGWGIGRRGPDRRQL
jgi:hypothetical protein